MADYHRSRVVSLRIDEALLDAVRVRAREDGRSVSGQIVFFVRERVESAPLEGKPPRKISGWLSHRESVESLGEFRSGRERASAQLSAAVQRKARR
ncbi:MAG: hypothetical protein R3B13_30810 [Polyangiaceae bacterium]